MERATDEVTKPSASQKALPLMKAGGAIIVNASMRVHQGDVGKLYANNHDGIHAPASRFVTPRRKRFARP